MSNFTSTITGAIGGAVLAVAIVIGLSSAGLIPQGNRDAAIHDYLMDHPGILIAMSNKLQAQEQAGADAARGAAVAKLGLKAFFDPKIAFVTGPANAKTTFVEFFDYNCPYCRASGPAVEAFYKAHKNDARFAFIEFPIKGDDSMAASRLAVAARMQPDKYLAYHFALMHEDALITAASAVATAKSVGLDLAKLEKDEKDASVTASIAGSLALARAAGVDGTPAFVIDGKLHEGALTGGRLAALAQH